MPPPQIMNGVFYSFKLGPITAPEQIVRAGGGRVLSIRLLFIVWARGRPGLIGPIRSQYSGHVITLDQSESGFHRAAGTNWAKINEGVLFNKSNRLGEENTITGAKWYNSFVRWYPLRWEGPRSVSVCSFQFSLLREKIFREFKYGRDLSKYPGCHSTIIFLNISRWNLTADQISS